MKMIQSLALAFLALAFAGLTHAHAGEVDRSDPSATAQAFLTAYKARDLQAMAPLANATNKDFFEDLAAKGEAHEAYGDMFSGWRWEAASTAPDAVGELRYNGSDAAVLINLMPDNEVAVIVLTLEDGKWGIEDINSPSASRFSAFPTTPQSE